MRVLVTGLCLQGNKGGPAIALSLMKQLKKYLPELSFVFSVPSGSEFPYERRWSERYGISIVDDLSPHDVHLGQLIAPRGRGNWRRLLPWLRTAAGVNAIIEMSAISYVGPPIGTEERVLTSKRVRYRRIAKWMGKPFLAWTQSYGPFSTPAIRKLAIEDLQSQPVVLCRGNASLELVKELLPEHPARSFPDVAVVLAYDRQRGRELIAEFYPDVDLDRLVTISPSSQVYLQSGGDGPANHHLEEMIRFCTQLRERGHDVLLVPHTMRPGRPDVRRCDYAICAEIVKATNDGGVCVVGDDLSPIDLKSIISNAVVHVSARYHSVIAALSAGVPCVSISWHHKYRDIMQMYGVENFVYDGVRPTASDGLIRHVEEAMRNAQSIRHTLAVRQSEAEQLVDQNTRLFASWLRDIRSR